MRGYGLLGRVGGWVCRCVGTLGKDGWVGMDFGEGWVGGWVCRCVGTLAKGGWVGMDFWEGCVGGCVGV